MQRQDDERVEWGDLYRSPKVVGTRKRHEALRRTSCLYLTVTWQNAERCTNDQANDRSALRVIAPPILSIRKFHPDVIASFPCIVSLVWFPLRFLQPAHLVDGDRLKDSRATRRPPTFSRKGERRRKWKWKCPHGRGCVWSVTSEIRAVRLRASQRATKA